MPVSLRRALLLLGLGSVLLHGWYLHFILGESRRTGVELWHSGDTPTYIAFAQALRGEGTVSPAYRERILLPALMAGVEALGGQPADTLWLVVAMELPAVYCVGYLGWRLARRAGTAVLSALLYVLYANTYGRGVLLDTDVLHAQLTLVAVALTWRGWEDGDRRAGGAACLMWPILQLLRPTMYLVAIPLAVLAWDAARRRRAFGWAAALLACAMAVPATMAARNWRDFGIAAPSLLQAENLWVWAVPRIRTLQRNADEPAPLTQLFAEEQARARSAPFWKDLHAVDGDLSRVPDGYRAMVAESRAFLSTNQAWFIKTCWSELVRQTVAPPVLYFGGGEHPFIESLEKPIRRAHRVGLVLALLGVAYSLQTLRVPWLLFMLLLAGMIMGPATIVAWWQGSKYRLLLDVLLLPWAALSAQRPFSWCVLGAVLLVAYVPRVFLGAGSAWFNGAAISLVAAGVAVAAARAWSRRAGACLEGEAGA